MTIYTQDFSEYTTDAAPSDWTDRWHTEWTNTVRDTRSDTHGDKHLEIDTTASNRKFYSWDDIDGDANRANSEVLARVRLSGYASTSYWFGLVVRGSGDDTAETGMTLFGTNDDLRLTRYSAGVATTITTAANVFTGGESALDDYWFWIRFRANGTDFKGRVWRQDEVEPGYWQLEDTDSTVSAAGWVGVQNSTDLSPYVWVDYFAVGTDGDSPSVPADSTAQVNAEQAISQIVVAGDAPAAAEVRAHHGIVQYVVTEPDTADYIIVNVV